MNEYFFSFDFVYHTIGLEMNFQISSYIYSRQFGWNVPSFREII